MALLEWKHGTIPNSYGHNTIDSLSSEGKRVTILMLYYICLCKEQNTWKEGFMGTIKIDWQYNAWGLVGNMGFNSVLSVNDKLNGQPVHQAELVDYQECIKGIGLGKLNRKGY